MATFTRISIPLAAAVLLGGTAAGTAGAETTVSAPGAVQPEQSRSGAAADTVKVKKGKYGKILVDGKGRTLYLFKKDKKNKSNCHGGCASAWPPMTVDKKAQAGKGVKKSELSTTDRGNGKKQVTYNGHPLYRFAEDGKPGQTEGQGLDQFGAKWYVVDTKGKAVVHKPKHGGSPKPKDSHGGY